METIDQLQVADWHIDQQKRINEMLDAAGFDEETRQELQRRISASIRECQNARELELY